MQFRGSSDPSISARGGLVVLENTVIQSHVRKVVEKYNNQYEENKNVLLSQKLKSNQYRVTLGKGLRNTATINMNKMKMCYTLKNENQISTKSRRESG